MDDNGRVDLVVAYNLIGDLQWFTNTDVGFAPRAPVDHGMTFGGYSASIAVADVNNDGLADLLNCANIRLAEP